MIRILSFIALMFAPTLIPTAAQADYYLWQDAHSGLTATFPDTWQKQSNQNPDTVLTIEAPDNLGKPLCKVNVSDDRRYVIFPPKYGDAVQRDAISTDFWKSYMGLYDEYTLNQIFDGAGLGRWRASYAQGSWTLREGTVHQTRRGLMFASLYYDKLYVVECSSLNHAYEKWENDFRSIIKSIDFKKIYHERKTGDYADFLKRADKFFWSQTGPKGTIGYN